jgi:hypothetical protein
MPTLIQVYPSYVLTHANPIPGVSQLCVNPCQPYPRCFPAMSQPMPTLSQVCPSYVLTRDNRIPGVSQLSCEPDVLHYLDHKSLQLEHTTLLGNFTMESTMD